MYNMSDNVTDVEAVEAVEAPVMPEAPTAPAGEPVQLSFADLSAAVQVIDVFVARGAVRGEELSSVGAVRDRLFAFVKQAQEQQQAPETPEV